MKKGFSRSVSFAEKPDTRLISGTNLKDVKSSSPRSASPPGSDRSLSPRGSDRGSDRSGSGSDAGSDRPGLRDIARQDDDRNRSMDSWDAKPRGDFSDSEGSRRSSDADEKASQNGKDTEDKADKGGKKRKSVFTSVFKMGGDGDSDKSEEPLKEEKPRTPFGKKHPRIAEFVESDFFEWLWLACIAFDCIHVGARVDCASPPGCSDSKDMYLFLVDHLMVVFFIFEWLLRYACTWHQEVAHLCSVPTMLRLDTFLVWVSGAGVTWIFTPLGVKFKVFGFITVEFLGYLRVMRASRIIASTHALRNIEVLKEMWLLLVGVGAALTTLVPSLCLMLFTIYIFSCLAVTLIGRNEEVWADDKIDKYVADGDMTEEDAIWPKRFRTLSQTLFTISRLMTFDNSGAVMDAIAIKMPWAYGFFLSCTALTAYCLLNLVTAVITNNAMEITKADAINHANEEMEKKKEQMQQLQELFTSLDDDGSGEVSTQEFEEAFDEPQVRHKLLILGFDEDELKKLFKLLDSDDTGQVDANEFCQGLSKLSGLAQARDLLTSMKTGTKVEKKLRGCVKMLFPAYEHSNFVSELEMGQFIAACDDKRKRHTCTCRKDRKLKLKRLKEYETRVERLEIQLERIMAAMRNLKKVRRQIRDRKAASISGTLNTAMVAHKMVENYRKTHGGNKVGVSKSVT
eukprot:gnl/MRDRNA2_/MRDRNA2_101919_c0_seq1.p1 gnl/MRDRNA2_/MRDRNA2_101919_c0~~gnl/MRDRNA2_/MRDRNA2_101919_c0_seq1.p1  ORF type:complete len:683 (+),score=119.46 gnl/MRDRNA2_/MRDRNA2_101919_c0_seq1:86-2134(+)